MGSKTRRMLWISVAVLIACPVLATEESGSDEPEASIAEVTEQVFEEMVQDAPETEPAVEEPIADREAPPVSIRWDRGLRIEGRDKRFRIKVGGRVLADATHISGDRAIGSQFDTGWLGGARQARIDLTGTVGSRWYGRVQIDLTGDSGSDYSPSDYVVNAFLGMSGLGFLGRVQAGIFKQPVSMGVLTGALNLDFMERGLPTVFAPNFNVGIMLNNEHAKKRVAWALGVFRGQG